MMEGKFSPCLGVPLELIVASKDFEELAKSNIKKKKKKKKVPENVLQKMMQQEEQDEKSDKVFMCVVK